MYSAMIHYSGHTLAQINTDVTLCADNVSGSAGEEEIRTSGNLAGADLVTAASTAANAIQNTRTRFSNRLRHHAEGVYDFAQDFATVDTAVADGMHRGASS